MSYEVEETGELSRRAQVTVPGEEFEKAMTRELRKLAGRVKLSGFRKGKVPLGVMRRQYGPSVTPDIIEELVNQHVSAMLQERESVIFLAQPEITKMPKGSTPLEFTVDFELRPSVDPIGFEGIEVERPRAEVDKDEIDERIEQLRQQHAALVPIELRDEIKEGDVVEFDFHAIGDAPELEQLRGDDVQVEVGSGQTLAGLEQALVGAKFGSTVTATVDLDESFPVEELRDREVELEVRIKSVKKEVLPEVDDEFAADTGKGQTLVELRSALRDEIRHDREHQAQHMAEDNMLERLLEQNDFELPPRFVREQLNNSIARQFRQMLGQEVDPRMLDGEQFDPMREDIREQVERQIKSEFLLMAIAEKKDFKVGDEDLKAYCEHQAQHAGVDVALVERQVRSSQQALQQAMGSALIEKTLGYLLENAKVTEVDWPEPEEEDFDEQE